MISRKRVGEIPLLQATVRQIRCREVLERHIRGHGNEKVSSVDAIMLLVFNIARSRQPLYELEDWVRGLDPRMFKFDTRGEGINDDRFGRALDKIYAMDRASAMTEIVLAMVESIKLDLSELHNDSTTLKAFGRIPGRTRNGLFMAKGHSKDHRPDLKQLVYCLTVSADGSVPVHFKTYPGNYTDDKTHIETWELLRKIAGRSDFLYVADCKVCTDKQLSYIDQCGGRVVAIMPGTWKEVQIFKDELRTKKKARKIIWTRRKPNGFDEETETFSCYNGGGVTTKRGYKIHWIYSSEKKKRDRAAREARLQKTECALTELNSKLNTRKLRTKTDIMGQVAKILELSNAKDFYHIDLTEIQEQRTRQVGKGRPSKNTQYETYYTTTFTLAWTRQKTRLKQEQNTDGVFPLVSTDASLQAKEALVAYKFQPRLEKRFQQLKSIHEGSPLLFKRIERVEAIMFLFFLALILQAIIERQVRRQMKAEGIEDVPVYPEHRRASHPTTTKIFDRFHDVSTYELREGNAVLKRFRDDLTKTQKDLLGFLNISEDQYWNFASHKRN